MRRAGAHHLNLTAIRPRPLRDGRRHAQAKVARKLAPFLGSLEQVGGGRVGVAWHWNSQPLRAPKGN